MDIDSIINAIKSGASDLYTQGKQELGTMDQPHALTDVLNRGLVAGTLGAPVDLINTGLKAGDWLANNVVGPAIGSNAKVHIASDKPIGGSESIQDLLEKYGAVTPQKRPVLEAASNLAPMLIDPAIAAGKALAPMAGDKLSNYMADTGMLLNAAPRGKKVAGAASTDLTPEQQRLLDIFGSKQDREAMLKKRVEQDAADEAAGVSSIKAVRARAPVGAVTPDYYRQMAYEKGDDAVLRAAAAGKHLRPDGAGGYIGGPRTVTSPQGLGALRRHLDTDFGNAVDAVQIADPDRMGTWYDRAKSGIAQSSEPHLLDPVLDQHSVYSAGVSPESELAFALKHLTSRAVGDPVMAYRGAPMRNLDTAAAENRNANLKFKTGEYRDKNDPRLPNVGLFGVNDFRRAQGMDYTLPSGEPWQGGVSDTMHPFMDAETALQVNRANEAGVGGRTNWGGPHIQELPWVLGKGQDIFTRGERGRFAGEGTEGIEKAIQEANNTARDYFYKHAASGTHEAIPGASTGHVPSMLTATPEEKLAYTLTGRWDRPTPYSLAEAPDVGAGNRDVIYSALGLRQLPSEVGIGAYRNSAGVMEHNPLTIARPLVDFPTGGGGRVPDSTQRALDLSEQFRAVMDAQEAGAHNLPNTMNSVKGKNALVLDTRSRNPNGLEDPSLGVLPSKKELAGLVDLIDKHGMSDRLGVSATGRGATIFPFNPDESPKLVSNFLKKAGEELQSVYPSEVHKSLNTSGYVPGIGKWGEKGIEPTKPYSGEATMNLLENMAAAPHKIAMDIGESEAVRNAIKEKMARDAAMTGARGDIQETRRFFAEADWPKAVKMIREGATPAAALAALGYSASSMAGEKK